LYTYVLTNFGRDVEKGITHSHERACSKKQYMRRRTVHGSLEGRSEANRQLQSNIHNRIESSPLNFVIVPVGLSDFEEKMGIVSSSFSTYYWFGEVK
jgi:hypothetical protein